MASTGATSGSGWPRGAQATSSLPSLREEVQVWSSPPCPGCLVSDRWPTISYRLSVMARPAHLSYPLRLKLAPKVGCVALVFHSFYCRLPDASLQRRVCIDHHRSPPGLHGFPAPSAAWQQSASANRVLHSISGWLIAIPRMPGRHGSDRRSSSWHLSHLPCSCSGQQRTAKASRCCCAPCVSSLCPGAASAALEATKRLLWKCMWRSLTTPRMRWYPLGD